MASQGPQSPAQRNGKLSISLPFEDAVRAVLKVKPEPQPAKPSKKPRRKAAPRQHGTAP